ncbi:MAG: DMT family transporter [Gammaproteobacteria bacterium]
MENGGKKTTIPRRTAEGMLLAAAFFWGWTFPVMRGALAEIPVFALLFLRFALAAALVLAISRRLPPLASWRFGGLLGVALFAIFAFQTWGLVFTSSANSAFITGLNVVWVFLLSPGGRRRALLPACLAVAGLWLMTSPSADSLNTGDFLTLVCSVFIALHILLLARLDKSASSGDMAFIQFASVAAFSAACSAVFEPSLLPAKWSGELIFALILTAGGATVFSFWAQTHYQRHTTPVRAGLIFISEPVFAAIFAAGFYAEKMPPSAWPGAALILAAMILAVRRQ